MYVPDKSTDSLGKDATDSNLQLEDRSKEHPIYLQQLVTVPEGYAVQTKGDVNSRIAFRKLDGKGNTVSEAYVLESDKPFEFSVVSKEGEEVVTISSYVNSESFMNCSKNS